jgi:predicted Zn-ribbon and HTH transcriptional regulator
MVKSWKDDGLKVGDKIKNRAGDVGIVTWVTHNACTYKVFKPSGHMFSTCPKCKPKAD